MMTVKILCVDDDEQMLAAYKMLRHNQQRLDFNFQIETAENGKQGLAAVSSQGPYAVIISDMEMPGMSGTKFLSRVREIAPDTVRIMLTGFAQLEVAVDAVNEGNIFRFLTKPCPPDKLIKALQAGIDQYRLLLAEKELLEKTLAGSIKMLTDMLSLVNPTAFGRATRIRQLVHQIAAQLAVENVWEIDTTAMLSQIGCVIIPEEILQKVSKGSRLSPEERRTFGTHPKIAQDLIASLPRLEKVAESIAYQDRRFDGFGAPGNGRQETNLPLGARILKVALDFDTLESENMSKRKAYECLEERTGWYDPAVLDALKRALTGAVDCAVQEMQVRDLLDQQEQVVEGDKLIKELRVNDLNNHMILGADVLDSGGRLLLCKGQELTSPALHRLRNLAERDNVQEPIQVLVPLSVTI